MNIGVKVTVDDKDYQAFRERFITNFPLLQDRLANKMADRYGSLIRTYISARMVTGELDRSIKVLKLNGEGHYGLTMADYGYYLDQGTPVKGGGGYGTRSARLQNWCKAKGLNFFKLRQSIAKSGTKAHPYLWRVFMDYRQKGKQTIESTMRLYLLSGARNVN